MKYENFSHGSHTKSFSTCCPTVLWLWTLCLITAQCTTNLLGNMPINKIWWIGCRRTDVWLTSQWGNCVVWFHWKTKAARKKSTI
jgi:hypothetical protein